MVGPYLLVANVLQPLEKSNKKSVYLPEGYDWFCFEDRKKFKGGQTIEIPVTI